MSAFLVYLKNKESLKTGHAKSIKVMINLSAVVYDIVQHFLYNSFKLIDFMFGK